MQHFMRKVRLFFLCLAVLMVSCSKREAKDHVDALPEIYPSKFSCHKKFIKERRERLEAAKKTFKKNIQLRADNFVGGFPLPVEMLRLARYYETSPQRKKMVDYAICSYLILGDWQSFAIALQAFDIYKDKELPKAYSLFINNP